MFKDDVYDDRVIHQNDLNATLQRVKENSTSYQDSPNLDHEDIDVYMHQESENEELVDKDEEDISMTISNH